MNATNPAWPEDSICLRPVGLDVPAMAAEIYARTCRTNFSMPGFCVVNAGRSLGSVAFRQLMVDLKRAMAALHEAKTGATLVYLSAARFDQQETTRLHLDGGPEECLLMLGYEPSEVDAELQIADYARCAHQLGLTPGEFMERHNPMFQAGYEMLRPYTVQIPCFSPTDYQIVCINNSWAPYDGALPRWQGTLHTATIVSPDESKRRVINSTMIAPAQPGTVETVSAAELEEFIHTPLVRRRGYDKLHLEDDVTGG